MTYSLGAVPLPWLSTGLGLSFWSGDSETERRDSRSPITERFDSSFSDLALAPYVDVMLSADPHFVPYVSLEADFGYSVRDERSNRFSRFSLGLGMRYFAFKQLSLEGQVAGYSVVSA